MKLFITCAFALSTTIIFSQNSGYIVNSNSDTIRGYVKRSIEEKYTQGVFFSTTNSDYKFFTFPEIKTFGVEKTIYTHISYHDILNNNDPASHFAKLLLKGNYRLYSYTKDQTRYYVVETKDSSYMLFEDVRSGSGDIVTPANYQTILLYLGVNCNKTGPEVQRVAYSEKNILDYFTDLERCSGNNTGFRIYYSKSKMQTKLFLLAGGIDSEKYSSLIGQFNTRIINPSISSKLSLNIGIWYTDDKSIVPYYSALGSRKTFTMYRNLFEIPFTFQYNILTGPVQPYVNGGLAMVYYNRTPHPSSPRLKNKGWGSNFVGGLGMEITIAKKLLIKPDWRWDITIPAHLPTIGIGYWIK